MLMLNKGGRLLVTCMYRANLESSRTELIRGGNMIKIRASKRLKIQANRETNRASQRSLYWRNSSAARTYTAKRAQYQKRKREGVRRRQHATTEIQLPPKDELCMEYYGLARFF